MKFGLFEKIINILNTILNTIDLKIVPLKNNDII